MALVVGCHLPALLWRLCTPGPPHAEQVGSAQWSRVFPVPFQHQISLLLLSLQQGCRVWSGPKTLELHPLWDSLLAPSLQQGRCTWPSKPKGKAGTQSLGFPPYLLRKLLHLQLLPGMSCSHRSSIQLQRQSKQLSVRGDRGKDRTPHVSHPSTARWKEQ